jgi:SAM-dependent methyltransferase
MEVYSHIAESFHATRNALWPGVKSFMDKIPKYAILGDIGCGNGKYATYRKDIVWLGADPCKQLLYFAQNKNPNVIQANGINLPFKDKSLDYSISIAVVHHLTTPQLRKAFIKELIRTTKTKILFTVWAEEQPKKPQWQHQGNNDYLIPWQNQHMRYYHLFPKQELEELLTDTNYTIKWEQNNWFCEISLL